MALASANPDGRINLTEARLNNGHSIRSLAEHLGVHQHSIRRLEAGERIHPAAAKTIADYFGCSVVDLMPLEEAA
jgi:plasmid maintenance system antidote protein VapI